MKTHPLARPYRREMINEQLREGSMVTTQVKYKSPEGRSLCYIMRNNWRNMARGGSPVTRRHRRRFR